MGFQFCIAVTALTLRGSVERRGDGLSLLCFCILQSPGIIAYSFRICDVRCEVEVIVSNCTLFS